MCVADGVVYTTRSSFQRFDHWWMSVHNDHIVYFKLKGAQDAHIMLTKVVG